MLVHAIRFGQMGWLSGEGGWQWDRQLVAIRALLSGSPALCGQVGDVLRERGHLVVAELAFDDPAKVLRHVTRSEPGVNVLGLCLQEQTCKHNSPAVEAICQKSQLPVVVFAKSPTPRLFSDCLQAGAFGCLEVPSHHSEALAILGIAASRFERFHGLRRRLADIEWSLQNPQVLARALEVLAGQLEVSSDEARRKLCFHAESRGVELKEAARSVLDEDSEVFSVS